MNPPDRTDDQLLFLEICAPAAYAQATERTRRRHHKPPLISGHRSSRASISPRSSERSSIVSTVPRLSNVHTISRRRTRTAQPRARRSNAVGRGQPSSSSEIMLQHIRDEAPFGIHTDFAGAYYGEINSRFLTFHSIAEKTRKAYLRAFKQFQSVVDVNRLSLDNLDEAIATYGNDLYQDDPRPAARASIERLVCYTLIAHPEIKQKL